MRMKYSPNEVRRITALTHTGMSVDKAMAQLEREQVVEAIVRGRDRDTAASFLGCELPPRLWGRWSQAEADDTKQKARSLNYSKQSEAAAKLADRLASDMVDGLLKHGFTIRVFGDTIEVTRC